MILPLRVWGRSTTTAISRGATADPSLARAWAISSVTRASVSSRPGARVTKALTIWPIVSWGMPITPASETAGCSISADSTSNGPIRWPADLITSSPRPTNQK